MATLSLTLRFRILQRDNFTCQYCGAKAPDVPLEVDHIQPRAGGGPDGVHNLITACYDCNRGKRDTLLSPAQVDHFSNRPVIEPPKPTRVRRMTVKRVLTRFFHRRDREPSIRESAPVALDFVYTGPDAFVPQYVCAICGMLNTADGDRCRCRLPKQTQEDDDSLYCRGCSDLLEDDDERYCSTCIADMYPEEVEP